MVQAVTPERVFEGLLHELGQERAPDDMMHAPAGRSGGPVTVSTAFRHRDVHDAHELALVTEGAARVATADQVYPLGPGRILVIDPGVEHDESPADRPESYVGFWCIIKDTTARLYRTTFSPPRSWRAGPNLELPGRTGLESMVRALATELDNHDWNWARASHALLVYLTSILIRRLHRGNVLQLRASESPSISADPRTWRVIQAALRYCDENFRRPIRLGDVATAVGYSPTHLSRLISTHLGHSLSDHIRGLRISAGKQLLETSDLSIGEISHALGYSDPAHFSHAFTRATGLSPRAYRRRMAVV